MKKRYLFILPLLLLIFIFNNCQMGVSTPDDYGNNKVKPEDPQAPPMHDASSVDADGDGIYAYYDYDDSTPDKPEPCFAFVNDYSPGISYNYGYIWHGVFSMGDQTKVKVFGTTNQNIELYHGYFKYINGLLYYSPTGGNSWTYNIDKTYLWRLSDIAAKLNLSAGSTTVTFNPNPIFTSSDGTTIGGDIFLLFDKTVLDTANGQQLSEVINTISTAMNSGFQDQGFNNMLNNIAQKYRSYDAIKSLLSDIRDYFPYGFSATVFRKYDDTTRSDHNITVSVDNSPNLRAGKPVNCFYPDDIVYLNMMGALNIQWNAYMIGIARNLPDEEPWILNLDQNLKNYVDYKEIPISGNSFPITREYVSDAFIKRAVFVHGSGTSIDGERADFIFLLPIYNYGLDLQVGPVSHNGIVKRGQVIRIYYPDGLIRGRVLYNSPYPHYDDYDIDFKNSDLYITINPNFNGEVITTVVSKATTFDIEKKAKFRFFCIDPYLSIQNLSASDGQYVKGDKLNIGISYDPSGLITGSDGKMMYGITNTLTIGAGKYQSLNNTITINNYILKDDSLPVTGGLIQKGNNNFIGSNTVLAVKTPQFAFSGANASYTMGDTINVTLQLQPSDAAYLSRFNSLPVNCVIKNNGAMETPLSFNFGDSTTLQYTFTNTGSFQIQAILNYNGVQYSKTLSYFIASSQLQFQNLANGDTIYPALGGRKIAVNFLVNTPLTFTATAGGFASTPNGAAQNPFTVTTGSDGTATVYYIAAGAAGNSTADITVQSGGANIGGVTGLIMKYNDSFTLIDIMTNTNAVLTYESGSYHSGDAVSNIQMFLNQVCPRKVSTAFGANKYNIINEDGAFGSDGTNAIHYLKNYFVKATNSFCMTVNAFSNDMNLFTKLSNQYPLLTSPDMLVDWKLLCGTTLAIGTGNDITPDGRDGLVEIYTNVICSFIDQMIQAGEVYCSENSTTWKHRESPITEDGNPGVAYSWGGIDRIDQFTNKIRTDTNYSMNNWAQYSYGHQPGMYMNEVPYEPFIWAGIDCRGFVQRTCKSAKYSNGEFIISDIIIPDLDQNNDYDVSASSFNVNQLNNPGNTDNHGNCYTIASSLSDAYSKWLHRGDFIFSSAHIVIVYNEPIHDFSKNFKVINAYGENPADYNEDGFDDFSRKTIIMPYSIWNINTFDDPRKSDIYKYGRFTLWTK